jgi:hypothetical protein
VTDETILEGFRNLAQVMSEGFDNHRAEFTAVLKAEIGGLRREMNERFSAMDQRIGDLDHRMMRRFDEVGGRLDNHERRISTLEANR